MKNDSGEPQGAAGLHVDKVHVWRGERHVLKGVSVDVGPGEAVHVAGPNGTGKTTLLRVVSGLLHPEQGTVHWCGRPIPQSAREYQLDMAFAAHEPALKGDLTVLENLEFAISLRRRVAREELHAALDRAGAAACAHLPARVLSAGQRRRVTMARVLASRSRLWLLDEPFTNLDVAGTALMLELLNEHVAGGGLALIVAHHELALAVHPRLLRL